MKTLTILFSVLVIGTVLAITTIAAPVPQRQVQNQDNVGVPTWLYAQLTMDGNERLVWDVGGPNVPRGLSLNGLYRELGGNQRATLVNVLSAIGAGGWELVEVENNTWTFKRPG